MRDWKRDLRARLAALNLGPEREIAIIDELSLHLEERCRELIAGGLSPAEAESQTRQELQRADLLAPRLKKLQQAQRRPTVAMAQFEFLASRSKGWSMSDIVHDVRYALRGLRAAPVFTAAALLTLALGIGANTAIFSLVHGVLLRPLPFPDAERLYAVHTANRSADLLRSPVSPVDLDDWRNQRSVIEDIGGYFYAEGTSGIDMTGRGSPQRLSAVFITPGFLPTLGVVMEKGRQPREDELTRGGNDTVVLLTHGFWMREFGGTDTAIGSSLTLNDRPYDVIGVLPPHFRFPAGDIDVMVPYSTIPDRAIPRLRAVRVLNVVARAKSGVDEAAVRAEMMAITGRLASQYPEDRAWDAATVVPLGEVITGPVHDGLLVLLGAVGFVLLMACVNVTNLQLARIVGRAREIGVRLALGAGRARLVQLFLIESIVLSVLGGLLGVGLAFAGVQALLALAGGQLPRAAEVTLDVQVLAFAVAITFLVGIGVAIAPIWRALRGDLSGILREGGRSVAGGSHARVRRGLVVAEVAVAMILVVGAGLMSRSFLSLLSVDAGFRAEQLIAVQFTINAERHSPPAQPGAPPTPGSPYVRYYSEVIEKVRTLPGIVSAAAVKDPPLRGNGERNSFNVPGRVVPAGQDSPTATVIHVSDGYFKTIGANVDGREFAPADRVGSPPVLVVNDALARQFFPGERAVGKRLLFGQTTVEIVGVVNDIRQVAMSEPARPTIYFHNLQNSRVKTTIVARTAGDPLAMADPIRQAIWSIDPAQAITAVFTFDEAVSRALARPRLLTVLLGAFGFLGLGLGAIGLYGALGAVVSERRREIGVRLALGAEPRQVLNMIVRGGLSLSAVGVAIGLTGAFGLTRFLSSILYGVTPIDPATFAMTTAVFVATGAAASWLPARRASRLDPVETLKGE